ncbi:hypothetical protein RFB95_001556 [Enterobacter hormaechei]|nr:hypothetical protein [Enterobacter hormaechei]
MLKYISIGANELDTYLDYALLSIVAIYLYEATPREGANKYPPQRK